MKIKQNKSVVVFEINDENRKCEFNGDGYKKPFIDFIQSLGFDAELKYDFSDAVVVNGEEFNICTDNASYMSKNAFSRDENIRKPINRFIILQLLSHTSSTIIKIHFNKEYDGDKLRKKINDAIQAKIDRRQSIIDGEIKDEQNTTAIAKHFMSKDGFKEIVTSIQIKEGKILFDINNSTTLTIKASGEFIEFDIYKKEVKSESDLNPMFNELFKLKEKTEKLLNIIKSNPLDTNLIEYCEKTYSKTYNVTKSEYSKY